MTKNIDVNNSKDLIEEVISKKYIKYYEYENFQDIEKINKIDFGIVYRAKWKNSGQNLILKSFNLNIAIIKEIIHEFELHHKLDFNKNIIQFFGITDKDDQTDHQLKEYLLIMEHADSGSLQTYLKGNFNELTWEDKYKLAYQLVDAVSYLHDEEIVHQDLHSGNILIHQNTIKLSDFGLSKRIKEVSEQEKSNLFEIVPYIDPKWLNCNINLMQSYSLNKKSDVYSIGVILWEISSGQPPFKDESYDAVLIMRIIQGYREKIIPDTPSNYSILYTECWNNEPDNRPTMNQVVAKLKAIIDLNNSSYNSSYHQIMQNFEINKEEIGPTIQNIHEVIFEEELVIAR
ncbi:unnamed protein product [Rhizophagus irregularis]|nr:unnamed protein product [Rhizophagus irregularis]